MRGLFVVVSSRWPRATCSVGLLLVVAAGGRLISWAVQHVTLHQLGLVDAAEPIASRLAVSGVDGAG